MTKNGDDNNHEDHNDTISRLPSSYHEALLCIRRAAAPASDRSSVPLCASTTTFHGGTRNGHSFCLRCTTCVRSRAIATGSPKDKATSTRNGIQACHRKDRVPEKETCRCQVHGKANRNSATRIAGTVATTTSESTGETG